MTDWEKSILQILRDNIRLVARPDYEETETWMVKPGCLEQCAKIIGSISNPGAAGEKEDSR